MRAVVAAVPRLCAGGRPFPLAQIVLPAGRGQGTRASQGGRLRYKLVDAALLLQPSDGAAAAYRDELADKIGVPPGPLGGKAIYCTNVRSERADDHMGARLGGIA